MGFQDILAAIDIITGPDPALSILAVSIVARRRCCGCVSKLWRGFTRLISLLWHWRSSHCLHRLGLAFYG